MAEPIPAGVLDHLAARGREMRTCTGNNALSRLRNPLCDCP